MKDFEISNKHRDTFISEAENLLNAFESGLLQYEKSPDKELIDSIFRVVHTLKGISGMFGFNSIVELTHDLETIYDGIRNSQIILSKEIFDVSFKLIDHCRKLLTDANVTDEHNKRNQKVLKSTIEKIYQVSFKPAKTSEDKKPVIKTTPENKHVCTWFILLRKNESLVKQAINMSYIIDDLAALGKVKTIGEVLDSDTTEKTGINYGGILLVTTASVAEIEEVCLFISDNITLTRIAETDLLAEEEQNNPVAKTESIDVAKTESIDNEKAKTAMAAQVEEQPTVTQNTEIGTTVTSAKKKTTISHISVSTDKLDRLMFLVSELVTTKSELLLSIENNNTAITFDSAKKIETLSKNFHDNAINIRLVPIKDMLLRFNRLIRDLSLKLNKKIEFIIQGEDTELDKNVLDTITDPVMHLIRNCIDHGIELPEVRKAKGKAETGIIKLNAYQSGNEIYIEISDDGIGIDPELIRRKAIEKGVIDPEAKLTTKELYDLIFLPGFSTAQSLSEVSGRGVGMDVVRRKIQELHGDIDVTSEVNIGTTIKIKLQQTIAIIDTLLVKVGNRFFAVPLQDLEVCTQELTKELYQDGNRRFAYQNDLVPFISLRETFRIKGATPEKENLLIISKNNKRYAFSVDRIIGEYQAVIKSFGKLITQQKYISGASILGDGNLTLILDTSQLIERCENTKQSKTIIYG
jgi:two-component system, chemotaxis family, sensor kinase CheA